MRIAVTNTQEDMALGLAKYVIITSFRQVTIFGEDYTKIVYMHTPTSFSIEKVGDNVDLDENVQIISGPRAEEIICEMIEMEKRKHSTFVWSGAHFINRADEYLLRDFRKHYRDPLLRDPVEPENSRRRKRGTVVYVVMREGDTLSDAYYQAYKPDGSIDEACVLPVEKRFWNVSRDDPEYKDCVLDGLGRKWPLKIIPNERKNENETGNE